MIREASFAASFDNIWVQPAAGDAGGALGAALALWHQELNKERTIIKPDAMQGSYLGPSYSDSEIENDLKKLGANYDKHPENNLLEISKIY